MKNIVHITSVHKRHDIRIFLKECVTLAQGGYNVTLVVADGLGDEIKSGVRIVDAGMPAKGRLGRMLGTTKAVYKCARNIDAQLYHFHDPELIPIGLKIKRLKPDAKVVFDSHENYADDIRDKVYINKALRPFIAGVYRVYERFATKRLDAVISATPSIKSHFEGLCVKSIDINNFPFEHEFNFDSSEAPEKLYNAVYIGAMSHMRGVSYLVDACAIGQPKSLAIAGSIPDKQFEHFLRNSDGWKFVDFKGQINRENVKAILASSKCAVVTFLPAANHIESQPNKMFEYMSAGLPIVASNFPLWKEIIEGNACGICVNPESSEEIANAIDKLTRSPVEAQKMGVNGRKAVLEKYNWRSEGRKLLRFYKEILGG